MSRMRKATVNILASAATTRLFLAAVVFSALVSCSHFQPVPLAPVDAGRVLELNDGGAFGDHFRYVLSGDELVAAIYRFRANEGYRKVSEVRYALSPAEAGELWSTVSKASIPDWRPIYEPSQLDAIIYDGIQWSVELRDGDRTYISRGDNTYPARHSVGEPTFRESNAYSRILKAFERASGRK